MVHVDKMLRVVSDWRPLYEGERQKTVLHVQNTLEKLSNQPVELPTLYDQLLNSPADCVLQDFPTQYCKEKVHTFAPEIFL